VEAMSLAVTMVVRTANSVTTWLFNMKNRDDTGFAVPKSINEIEGRVS
jgi:hypothetical protein